MNNTNPYFAEVKGRFGFGCMRLPMNGEEIDLEHFSKMVDAFLEAGLNYFDTAHPYIKGKSELALKECLVKRHPRSRFVLADKLTDYMFTSKEEILPKFIEQLDCVGVDYFDFYLMHAMNERSYAHFVRCGAFEVARQLKAEGKVKHLCISFHDSPEFLAKILSEQPWIEAVQIQFNYLDYEDEQVQSRRCLEVCRSFGISCFVMEPVRGGRLVNLPSNAKEELAKIGEGSEASIALRFAGSFDNIAMILSGMSNMEQMEDNLSCMVNIVPLSEAELDGVAKVASILKGLPIVPCTGCRYCVAGCPSQIKIPELFSLYNKANVFGGSLLQKEYQELTKDNPISTCLGCHCCVNACPQQLEIPELMKKVEAKFR